MTFRAKGFKDLFLQEEKFVTYSLSYTGISTGSGIAGIPVQSLNGLDQPRVCESAVSFCSASDLAWKALQAFCPLGLLWFREVVWP